MNRRIYIHESTLFKLREIKDQNSLSSDDEVFRYLITRHDYLCLVERMANPVESELLSSNGQLASGTNSAIRNKVHAQHNDSQLASGGISEPCSNSSRIISAGNSHLWKCLLQLNVMCSHRIHCNYTVCCSNSTRNYISESITVEPLCTSTLVRSRKRQCLTL